MTKSLFRRDLSKLSIDESGIRSILLDKVYACWVEGGLHQSWSELPRMALGLRWRNKVEVSVEAMVEMVEEADGSLLVLGAAGAGKSTMLQQVAEYLVGLARENEAARIPIIINLSSWTGRYQSLADWLVKELSNGSTYGLGRQFAGEWLAERPFTLLLDGLDEIAPQYRASCVQAVNDFRQEHEMPLLICCQTDVYETFEHRLDLGGEVMIEPLNRQQVEEYLEKHEAVLSGLRERLATDEILWSLIETPLDVWLLAGVSKDVDWNGSGDIEAGRQRLVGEYIDKRLAEGGNEGGAAEASLSWISNLAYQLQQRSSVLFFLEQLTPAWLEDNEARKRYERLNRLVVWLYFGLGFGLGVAAFDAWGNQLLFGFVGGVLLATVGGLMNRLEQIEAAEWFVWKWPFDRFSWFFLLFVMFMWGWQNDLGWRINVVSLILYICYALLWWVLVNGFVAAKISTVFRPNAGLYQTGRQALIRGGAGLLLFGVFLGVASGLIQWLDGNWLSGLLGGVRVGLLSGLFFGLLFGLYYGGGAFIDYQILRFVLARQEKLPWPREWVLFLDEMVACGLMRRVGGGYMFSHGVLRHYLGKRGNE
ncbi:MAG TPA: NACHT domain-containing protein [Anaerolineae bacterium]|nr:NACHT domain-containing protein [Anaerolineae bacterium]